MERKKLLTAAQNYVEEHIGEFHQRRLEKLRETNLATILLKKNPYLFKAKNITTASQFVETLLSATISSSEETIFGNWLEGLAIYIAECVHGGGKSTASGIDLEITKNGIRYVVVIKSGKNWGNKSQVKQMKDDFIAAGRRLKTSGHKQQIEYVNGICYGRTTRNVKRPTGGPDYHFLCGQEFWEFVSDDNQLYIAIVEPLGHQAQERNEEFNNEYGPLVNRMTRDFLDNYCQEDGSIHWEKIVKLNSGKPTAKSKKGTTKKTSINPAAEKELVSRKSKT